MIKTSEEIKDLATALSKAQGELSDAEKSSSNPFYKSKYADLAEVLGQIRPIFSKHELSIVQFPSQEEAGHITVTTRLMHSSGQYMEASLTMPTQGKNIAQDSGSVITYMRRYAAAAVAGIAQVDEDANQRKNKDEELPPPEPVQLATTEDIQAIRKLIKETDTEEAQFVKHCLLDTLEQLPLSRVAGATDALQDKKKGMESNSRTVDLAKEMAERNQDK